MAIEFENPLTAGTVLVREAIQSQNYSPGTAGWIVQADGDAEFNAVTIRGGTVVSGTALYYDPAPGPGNLIMSIAAAAGTDVFGNTYPKGFSVGSNTTRQIVLDHTGTDSRIAFSVNNGHGALAGTLIEAILNEGAPNEYLSLQVAGPAVTGHTDQVKVLLSSQNLDGSSNANLIVSHSTAGTLLSLDPVVATLNVPLDVNDGITANGLTVLGDISANASVYVSGDIAMLANNTENFLTGASVTLVNGGAVTWTSRTIRWMRLGPLRWVRVDLVVNAAGSGAGLVGVTLPFTVNRTTRQILPLHAETVTVAGGTGAATIRNGQCLFFSTAEGGAGNTSDRWRVDDSDGDGANNLQGIDLRAGAKITIEGWIFSD